MTTSVTREEFDRIFESVRTWGWWGDGRGSVNHAGPGQIIAAAELVSIGRTVSLAHDLDTVAGPDNPSPTIHHMTQLSDIDSGEPRANMDFIGTAYHGKSVTHLDAFCHCNFEGDIYDGASSSAVVSSAGGSSGSVLELAAGIVGRAVLIDVPGHRKVGWLDPGTAVEADELQAVARSQGTEVGAGDLVFVRTGHRARRAALGAWDPTNFSAGLHPASIEWLAERRVAVLGSDGDSDARPSPVDGIASPIHALALVAMGAPLLDNMNLEDVAGVCSELGRWEFLCTVAPLRIPGGTGSPVNPLALF